MKIANLCFAILPLAIRAVRKHFRQAINRLALPGAHLVRMHLMLRGDLLDRLVAPQRLQRHTGLEFTAKPPSRRHVVMSYPSVTRLNICGAAASLGILTISWARTARRHDISPKHVFRESGTGSTKVAAAL